LAKMAAYYEEAERLFVQEGLSLREIARRLGGEVSESTLARWSVGGDWMRKRKEYLRSEEHFAQVLQELKHKLALAALEDPNPQNVYALCRVIAVLKPSAAVELRQLEKEEAEGRRKSPEEIQRIIAETLESYYGIKLKE